MFRKTGYIYGKVYITGWHFMDFPMPQVGDYELMVRGRYEGGDGPVRKIRIQGEIQQWIQFLLNLEAHLSRDYSDLFLRKSSNKGADLQPPVPGAPGAVHCGIADLSMLKVTRT